MKPPSHVPIYAGLGMSLITAGAIVSTAVFVDDPQVKLQVIASIIATLTPTTVALLALLRTSEVKEQTRENSVQLQQIKVDVDGRLTQLLRETSAAKEAAGLAAGLIQGRAAGKAEAEALEVARAEVPPELA